MAVQAVVSYRNYFLAEERIIRHGPVFTQEPSDSVFPLTDQDNKIFINCKAKGNPMPHYRWKFNGKDLNVDTDLNYTVVEGNLLINNPEATKHGGSYQCIAANTFGTILSREAKVEFAYLQNFSSKARGPVSVREGQAVVLLCGPPPHFGGPPQDHHRAGMMWVVDHSQHCSDTDVVLPPVGSVLWAASCGQRPRGAESCGAASLWGRVLWRVSCGQHPVGSVLWAASLWGAESFGECPVGSILWAASCGQRPCGAESCGQRPVGSVLWAASCGQPPVGSLLWAASCGQPPVDSVLWAASLWGRVLWTVSCGQHPCGQPPVGSLLWAASCGQRPCGAESCGQRPVDSVLWAASCGQRPVGSVPVGQSPMESVLWAASCGQRPCGAESCGQRPVGSVLWAASCGQRPCGAESCGECPVGSVLSPLTGEIRYSWIYNGRPSVLIRDNRRFVSQRTGNLYIAKVEPSDVGNYTCVVKNMMTNATVYSSPTPVVLRRDGEGPQWDSWFILGSLAQRKPYQT
ncbi:hypothetical protein NFI96_008500 [Prochilodus magdalenae]|nr:hypothetical protein NFI96_008500 [Prochilodus magdalenae]